MDSWTEAAHVVNASKCIRSDKGRSRVSSSNVEPRGRLRGGLTMFDWIASMSLEFDKLEFLVDCFPAGLYAEPISNCSHFF